MDTEHVRSGAALEGRPAHRHNPGGTSLPGVDGEVAAPAPQPGCPRPNAALRRYRTSRTQTRLGVLVHFPDQTQEVVTVSDVAERRAELVGDIEQGWIVDDRHVEEGEFEGTSTPYG
jgi:hypothetical protein